MVLVPMSRRNLSESENLAGPQPTRKRIRDNHNELERVRRVNQKAQLDALRSSLPFQDMDEKASMVSIFVRAREYIYMLEQRITELQAGGDGNTNGSAASVEVTNGMPSNFYGLLRTDHPSSLQSNGSSNNVNDILLPVPQKLPSLQPQRRQANMSDIPVSPSALDFGRARELSVNPDHVQVHYGIPFYNAGLMNSNPSTSSSIEVSALITPQSSPFTKPHEPSLNADILRTFISDNYFKRVNSQSFSSSDEETNFRKIFQERRGSSLLMPFEEETVMFQKRDSLSALFSRLLPDFIDSSVLSSGDLSCHKCKKGMCNMIMIDCDKCHKWYHIKCANIESDSIPTNWNCCC